MNILMLYGFAPHTTANYLARAFKALGHGVRSAGAVSDLRDWVDPYRLWQHTDPLTQGQPLELGDWRPDIAVWIESGDMSTMALAQARDMGVPLAGWFIDTHNAGKLPWHKRLAPVFDYRFCAMPPAVDVLDAHWLPLACDPEIHTPRTTDKLYDLGWVGGNYRGHSLYEARFEAMRKLQQRYSCNFASGVYFGDMADVYGQARIGWHMSVTGNDLDMRPFEVLCSGTPLVADAAPESGLGDLLTPGVEWASYRDETEMFAVIDALLADEEWRETMAATGREAVLAAHTYQHRAGELLEICGV